MTKFSGIPPNNSPALTDFLLSVTSGNADVLVTIQALANLLFGGQFSGYTNTGTLGGTFYSANLGGLKVVYGTTGISGSIAAGGAASFGINFPASFFTTLRMALLSIEVTSGPTTQQAVLSTAIPATNPSGVSGWINNTGASAGTSSVMALCLGV